MGNLLWEHIIRDPEREAEHDGGRWDPQEIEVSLEDDGAIGLCVTSFMAEGAWLPLTRYEAEAIRDDLDMALRYQPPKETP